MFKRILFMAMGLFMFSTIVSAEIKLVDGANNVLALNVAGTWSVDVKLTERLTGQGIIDRRDATNVKLTYTEDKSVLDIINARENGKSLKYDVYSVGKITYTAAGVDLSKEYPHLPLYKLFYPH